MGDRRTLVKARQELEDLYKGIPDDSVDLTFKDMASFQQEEAVEKKVIAMETIREEAEDDGRRSPAMCRSPSVDFTKSLHEAEEQHHRQQRRHMKLEDELYKEPPPVSNGGKEGRGGVENGHVYDDVSGYGIMSPAREREEGGRSRRPGIPHTNICTLCNEYVRYFRNRCLVCGRVYCKKCVVMGMGAMTEGRKCIDCLGRRFSQRYIHKAGKTGCCCWRYPSSVKQQELIWAEKGPRRNGERRQGRSYGASRAITTETHGTPTRPHIPRPMSPMVSGTPSRSRAMSPMVHGTPSRNHVMESGIPSRSHAIGSPFSGTYGYPV